MKLFLIHAGFYDKDVSSGFYESHTNYFVVADNIKSAKSKARSIKEFKDKKMHIDGIMEVNEVDGYSVNLKSINNEKDLSGSFKKYSYDEVKKINWFTINNQLSLNLVVKLFIIFIVDKSVL